ncbi:SprT family zinc-dependent metalloprotease [Listeria booriae]|uniref:SprT-like domain-containing protein n=1 Tax=Listeria booriae TaxID=1552123 RepID=UPI0016299F18|nr:SprT-like domain-containing protein [Listeria booriae]MBC1890046.1 SprT family zinc-dependent metalloprotease [Listeria booriae]
MSKQDASTVSSTPLTPVTIESVTQELHKAFQLFNNTWFDGKLPVPAITIQSNGHKRLSMGWCSVNPVWGTKDGSQQMYEINLSAEFLADDFFEVMDTLLHEMVHLYHLVNNIQDTSRKGTYHNKKFRDKCLDIGFEYADPKPDKKHGYSFARIGQPLKDKIVAMDINAETFVIARRGFRYLRAVEDGATPEEASAAGNAYGPSETTSNSIKWVCPTCNMAVRSYKKEVHILCGDCNEKFVKS